MIGHYPAPADMVDLCTDDCTKFEGPPAHMPYMQYIACCDLHSRRHLWKG